MADAFGGQLTFPMLTVGGLIEGLRQDIGAGFDIREDDFTHPVKERWVRIYCVLLAHMTDNDADDLMTRLRSVGNEYLDYPELYAESQLLMNLAKYMAQMLIQCKIVNFTIDDIVQPTKKRLVHVLSGIVNYIRFRANRKEEFANIIQKMASQVEQKQALQKEVEEQEKKIEEIRKRRAEESAAVAKVLGEVEVSRTRFDQLSKNSAVLKKAAEDIKLQIGKKQLDIHKRQERMMKVSADIQKAEEQIVTSPDRFDAEIRDLENKRIDLEKLQQEKIAKQKKQKKLKSLRNPELKAEIGQLVKEISAESLKEKTREQLAFDLARVKGRNTDLQETAAALHKDIQKLKVATLTKQERLEKVEFIQRRQEEEAELKLKKIMIEDDKKKELGDEWELIEAQRQSIRNEAAEKTKEHEESMKSLQDQYASLITAFEAYNQNVSAAFRNAIPDELKEPKI